LKNASSTRTKGERIGETRLNSLVLAVVVVACVATSVQAAPVNTTGHWHIQVTNGAEFYSGVVTFHQVGQTVIGHAGNTTIDGTMVSDTKMNAKWNSPKGAGWMTVYFGAAGNTFQGTWGFNGRKANGSFVGRRVQ
jgi:hypothetical protein